MIQLLKSFIRIFPWILSVMLLVWMHIQNNFSVEVKQGNQSTYESSILTRMESIGELELIKYNFQEVTEIQQEIAKIDFKLFKLPTTLAPDSRAVLISQGSAAGCINLAKISKKDISELNDTIYISLPQPKLCYFKLDLEKSRIYDLEISGLSKNDRKKFMEKLYQLAEIKIKQSALDMGILDQTLSNAKLTLRPLLEEIAKKPVVLTFKPDEQIPLNDRLTPPSIKN